MPENMSKPSILPAPNCFKCVPSFTGTYQHLFVCHLLCPTDFQHPLPRPHFKCFQHLFTCFSQCLGLCCIQCYIQTVLFIIRFFCSQFNPCWQFFLAHEQCLTHCILACMFLIAYPSSDITLIKYLNWLTCSTSFSPCVMGADKHRSSGEKHCTLQCFLFDNRHTVDNGHHTVSPCVVETDGIGRQYPFLWQTRQQCCRHCRTLNSRVS